MGLVNDIHDKDIDKVVGMLARAYEEKQASVKAAMDPQLRMALIGAGLGAGVGGVGSIVSSITGKNKIKLKDILYSALLGSVPGGLAGLALNRWTGLGNPDSTAPTSVAAPAAVPAEAPTIQKVKEDIKSLQNKSKSQGYLDDNDMAKLKTLSRQSGAPGWEQESILKGVKNKRDYEEEQIKKHLSETLSSSNAPKEKEPVGVFGGTQSLGTNPAANPNPKAPAVDNKKPFNVDDIRQKREEAFPTRTKK